MAMSRALREAARKAGWSKTKTPHAQHRCVLPDGEERFYRKKKHAQAVQQDAEDRERRKHGKRKTRRIINSLKDIAETEYRVNPAEKAFIGFLQRGRPDYELLRNGWPDFLIRDGDNHVVAVEVKKYPDTLKQHQIECIKMLELGGIPTYVFRADKGDCVPWRKFLEDKAAAEERYKTRNSVLRKAPQTSVERRSKTRTDRR